MGKLEVQPLKVQAIGLCRFSYLGEGGFKTAHPSLAERRAYLYDPRRLGLRMIWFEQVFLPSWRGQTDQDYTLVILTGEDLPREYRDQLEALTKPLARVRLVFRPPGQHRKVCHDVVAAEIDPAADVTAQFRLDDDDAVAFDFIEALRRDFQAIQGLYQMHGKLALDYGRGVLLIDRQGQLEVVPRLVQSWAAGLTLFQARGHDRMILDIPHHKIAIKMPMVLLSDRVMFVRGSHAENDSPISADGHRFELPKEKTKAMLRNRFGIKLAALEKALSLHHAG